MSKTISKEKRFHAYTQNSTRWVFLVPGQVLVLCQIKKNSTKVIFFIENLMTCSFNMKHNFMELVKRCYEYQNLPYSCSYYLEMQIKLTVFYWDSILVFQAGQFMQEYKKVIFLTLSLLDTSKLILNTLQIYVSVIESILPFPSSNR